MSRDPLRTGTAAWVFSLLLAVTMITGCADDSSSGQGDTTDAPPTTAPPTTAPPTTGESSSDEQSGDQVAAVSLRRAGGLKPTSSNVAFTVDGPPPAGRDAADVDEVIRAAQAFVDKSPTLTPMPDDQCCDRVAYTVTIVTADGSTHTYRTLDGLQQPPVFERLLSALS